jgi:hypothetical protein
MYGSAVYFIMLWEFIELPPFAELKEIFENEQS